MSKYYQGIFQPKNRKKCLNTNKIIYRSSWELSLMMHLDKTPEILEWASESLIIPYIGLDDKPHRYFPDFYIKIRNSETKQTAKFILEVKPKRETKAPKKYKDKQKLIKEQVTFGTNQLKWNSAEKFCISRGMNFRVITEKDLGISRTSPKPINLQKVLFNLNILSNTEENKSANISK